jgi:hypothetical protein
MKASFIPTLIELYREERGPMNNRESMHYGHARNALNRARKRLNDWYTAFPNEAEPVKLAKFLRAKRLTGKKLHAMLPAWVKRHEKESAMPAMFVFIPNKPPKFPAWTYY